MIIYHKGLSQERWNNLSLYEQMANIGSEVGRAISWKEKNSHIAQSAFYRALELIDLTAKDRKNIRRLKEVLRSREMFVDFFLYENVYKTDKIFWDKYFLAFNYLVRNKS